MASSRKLEVFERLLLQRQGRLHPRRTPGPRGPRVMFNARGEPFQIDTIVRWVPGMRNPQWTGNDAHSARMRGIVQSLHANRAAVDWVLDSGRSGRCRRQDRIWLGDLVPIGRASQRLKCRSLIGVSSGQFYGRWERPIVAPGGGPLAKWSAEQKRLRARLRKPLATDDQATRALLEARAVKLDHLMEHYVAPAAPSRTRAKTWMFYWMNGGYNTVQAGSRAEAERLAQTMSGVLVPDLSSLHIATDDEVARVDRMYAGMFD